MGSRQQKKKKKKKKQQKQWGFHSVLLAMTRDPAKFGWHCWSNTALPPPSSTTYVALQMPPPLLPLPQGCLCPYLRVASIRQPRGNSRCQSELPHNHSPLIPIPSTLTCLPHIHPPIIQGSLYSIHLPKPRPPSNTVVLKTFLPRAPPSALCFCLAPLICIM